MVIVDPPDSMPNSEVEVHTKDGSVWGFHVRVGHRQALTNLCGLTDLEIWTPYLVSLTTAGVVVQLVVEYRPVTPGARGFRSCPPATY